MSMQRHDVASMLIRRCLNVACPLVLCYSKSLDESKSFSVFSWTAARATSLPNAVELAHFTGVLIFVR